jgi:uncharacterized protein (DUF2249 family)
VSILALCPSRGRPKAAAETLVSFNATKRDRNSRIVFIVDSDDPTLSEYPARFTHVVRPTGSMGGALRSAQKELIGDATSVGMIGDDNRFRTPGWDVILDGYLTEHIGMAYGDDGLQHERLPTSWWVSRKLVDVFPLAPPMLDHLYMDNWWKSLAEGAGCLKYFPDVDIEHLHPLAGKASMDATYKRSEKWVSHDREAFRRWERRQRNADIRRARGLIGDGQKRRILADWHHPALWESLAILFEDRFGWELVSMGGVDWTKHGWLLKSGPPIGWSEADYLCLDGAVDKGTHYELTEREYPNRPRKMMTPEQAFATRWDFVLGSVAEHQRTFAALAKQLGARFIHQVGNAKHPLDQGGDQFVMASANVRIRDRTQHVTYHQEFDRSVFAPSPITHPLAVTSLMLRLDWTSCDYRWLADAPGIKWSAPGGADPMSPDYLAPMPKVAERMKSSGWIWHDKRIGDGYGHVLHTAAAMGRPLIGHASHYSGLLGAPFWRDLETCIDLDRHKPQEALRLIKAVSAQPDWHAEMSANLVATFDSLVDFDAEAERIRLALVG